MTKAKLLPLLGPESEQVAGESLNGIDEASSLLSSRPIGLESRGAPWPLYNVVRTLRHFFHTRKEPFRCLSRVAIENVKDTEPKMKERAHMTIFIKKIDSRFSLYNIKSPIHFIHFVSLGEVAFLHIHIIS